MFKIIHQIWIGPKTIPPTLWTYHNLLREANSNFYCILWTNEQVFKFTEFQHLFWKSHYKNYTLLSDVLRLYILKKFGGIYLDLDMIPLRSFEQYEGFNKYNFIICKDRKGNFQNCFLYSRPSHPLLDDLLLGYKIRARLNKRLPKVFEYYRSEFFTRYKDVYVETNYKLFVDNSDQSVFTRHLLMKSWQE